MIAKSISRARGAGYVCVLCCLIVIVGGLTTPAAATMSEKKNNDSVAATTRSGTSNTTFVPTREWQTVRNGTPIPAGLHVRHNLQTGVTEAKLMDKEDTNKSNQPVDNLSTKSSLTLHPEKTSSDRENNVFQEEAEAGEAKIPFEELKHMLKKIKSDGVDSLDSKTSGKISKKFRSYTELKEELEAANMNVSTDSEVLAGLFEEFELYKESIAADSVDASGVENLLKVLNNMEYMIHQIDNAQLFTDMGGMSKIISPSLNSTSPELKSEALKLLGSAAQLNPRVQLKALESDFVHQLLRLLTLSTTYELKSRCLFALGALVRHFPAAQRALVSNGGLGILGKLLLDGDLQLRIRAMNLVNDLMLERRDLREVRDVGKREARAREYDSAGLEEQLAAQQYCRSLVELAVSSSRVDTENEDFHEVVYESLVNLGYACEEELTRRREDLRRHVERRLVRYLMEKYGERREEQDERMYPREAVEQLMAVIEGERRTRRDEL